MKGVDLRAGAVQAEQLRGAAECVPQRLHTPRHQPRPQEGDASPINLKYTHRGQGRLAICIDLSCLLLSWSEQWTLFE